MKIVKILLILSLLITPSSLVSAQETPTASTTNQEADSLPILPKPPLLPGPIDPSGDNDPKETIEYVTNKLIPQASARFVTIIAVLSMLGLIYAGIKYYTAFGDEGQADEGKKIAQYSIIGLIVSLMSLAIVSIIAGLAQFFQ